VARAHTWCIRLRLTRVAASGCGHCKALEPEYNQAAGLLEKQGFKDGKLAKVDCTTQRPLCEKNGVRGFPTRECRGARVEWLGFPPARCFDDDKPSRRST
jgi:hypothetical protein